MKMLVIAGWLVAHACPTGPMSLADTAGVIANFERESGPQLNPAANSRLGVGLPAWAGPRRRQMLATLRSRWSDGLAQLEYMVREAPYMAIRARLCAERDPGRAAALFYSGFEMPGRRTPEKTIRRAREIYRELR